MAVIGTGASAIQLIPEVAERADELLVFQRTPNWFVPAPDYHANLSDDTHWLMDHVPNYSQWYRFWLFWRLAGGHPAGGRGGAGMGRRPPRRRAPAATSCASC